MLPWSCVPEAGPTRATRFWCISKSKLCRAFVATANGLRAAIELQYRLDRAVFKTSRTHVLPRLSLAANLLTAHHRRARIRLVRLVLSAFISFLAKLRNLAFEVAFFFGQRCIRFNEIKSRRVQLEQLPKHVCLDAVQLNGIAHLDGSCRGRIGRLDSANDFGNAHKSSPGVEKGGVGTSDSTSGGNTLEVPHV